MTAEDRPVRAALTEGGRIGMRHAYRSIILGMAVLVALVATGCGQDIKRENEQLKSQVSGLQKENGDLKGQVTSLKADADALKQQVEGLTKDKQDLEEKLKEAEAKASAKPGTKPPLKAKKSS
jgi:predicted nuclease with TOPRIM domain